MLISLVSLEGDVKQILRLFFSNFSRGDESDYSEDDLNINRSDGSGSSASRVEPEPVMTKYVPDSYVEQFGTANDQTEEFSDENKYIGKGIFWFKIPLLDGDGLWVS